MCVQKNTITVSKQLFLRLNVNFSAKSWQEQFTLWWDDDNAYLVPDKHSHLEFYSSNSMKQQSAGKHVALLY